MEKELLYSILKGEKMHGKVTLSQLEKVVSKYPYFQTARLMLVKHLKETQHPNYLKELEKVSVECSDRNKLFYYLNDERFSRFFSSTSGQTNVSSDRTDVLLSSFLNSIEEESDKTKEDADEVKHIEHDSIISSDYLAYLEKIESNNNLLSDEEESNPMSHQNLVDSFLEKSSEGKVLFSENSQPTKSELKPSEQNDSLLDDDTFLTETLAQVYIKQKKYEQALAIIKRLSLNFPKKSIYFADQIRFLEYLIINEKNKNKNK